MACDAGFQGDPGAGPAEPPLASEVVDLLYRQHALTMIRLALMLVGDQASAEDVVQDAFMGCTVRCGG